jgi:hypothetical protein
LVTVDRSLEGLEENPLTKDIEPRTGLRMAEFALAMVRLGYRGYGVDRDWGQSKPIAPNGFGDAELKGGLAVDQKKNLDQDKDLN